MSEDSSESRGGEKGEDELTIEQVSRLLGVPTPTLRSWERRHGIPVVGRTTGGHRRYTMAQVDMLKQLRDQVASGRRAVDAAAEVRARSAAPASLVAELLEAARGLRSDGIITALDRAERALGLGGTVDDVLLPAMREIGNWWAADQHDVAHEHLATNAARAWLSRVAPGDPVEIAGQPPLVLCCAPRDHHTLGLEAIAALLRSRGRDCRLLGARTPAASLARAVQETGAAGVVLVCHLPAGRTDAVEALRQPQLAHTEIFYAGGAFASRQARQGLPGHYLGTNLSAAAELVIATVDARGRGAS